MCAGIIGEGVIFIQVPWRDEDPARLAEYKANKESENPRAWFDSGLDHLLWTPHPSMIEVKEWEMLKWKSENHKSLPEGEDDN